MPSKQNITSDQSLVNIFHIKERECSKFYSTFIGEFTDPVQALGLKVFHIKLPPLGFTLLTFD